MRFPVFGRGSNPSIDRPILRKPMSYLEEEVNHGRARWIDLADPRRGILCLELLYFGPPSPERLEHQRPVTFGSVLPPLELHGGPDTAGTKYIGPRTAMELAAMRAGLLVKAKMWAKASTLPPLDAEESAQAQSSHPANFVPTQNMAAGLAESAAL